MKFFGCRPYMRLHHLWARNGLKVCYAFLLILLVFVCRPYRTVFAQDEPSESSQREPTSETSLPEQADEPLEQSPELSLFEEIPIVVSASKKPERVTAAPSIISVIRAEEIERMGARTLMDVLRTIPGMEVWRDNLGISQLSVRGLREGYSPGVKILIDGHSLNDPFTGGATTGYDDLSLKNVSRIEIIRGPASALYGANAFVSIIHVITKTVEEVDGVSIAVGAGSFDSYNPSFLFGKAFNDLELILSADYMTTNGADLEIKEDGFSGYDRLLQDSGLGPVSLAPGTLREEREKIDLSWKMDYQNFTFQGKFLEKRRGPFLTDFFSALNHDSFEETRHFYADLKYQRYLTERIEVDGRLYADSFSLKNNQQAGSGILLLCDEQTSFEFSDGLIVEYGEDSHRYGVEGQVNLSFSRNHDLTLGAAYEYSGVDDVFFRTNTFAAMLGSDSAEPIDLRDVMDGVKHSSFQHFAAFFARDHWRIRPSIGLTLGLRGDYYSEFGGVLTPKAGLTYEPNSNWSFKALFGSAFRVPSFIERFFAETNWKEGLIEDEDEDFEVPDELMVEELYTYELGMGYHGSELFHGHLNYFYSDLNQLVEVPEEEAEWGPVGSSRLYKSIGGLDVHGLEAEIAGSSEREIGLGIIPRIIGTTYRVNYSYQRPTDSHQDEPTPNVARHKGNIGVAFNLSAAEGGEHGKPALFRTFSDEFSLSFNLFLCGERRRSADDIREALPGYATLDMTLKAYDLFRERLDVAFTVKNMFDEKYYDPSFEALESEEDYFWSGPIDVPNPGRAFFIEFRYTF